DLVEDPRCSDDIIRGDNCELINEVMIDWCRKRTRDEAIAALEKARVPCGPVYRLEEGLTDPQVKARERIQAVEFPGGSKPVRTAASAVRLARQPGRKNRRAPMLGEHTAEVLASIGFDEEEIAGLRESGAI